MIYITSIPKFFGSIFNEKEGKSTKGGLTFVIVIPFHERIFSIYSASDRRSDFGITRSIDPRCFGREMIRVRFHAVARTWGETSYRISTEEDG